MKGRRSALTVSFLCVQSSPPLVALAFTPDATGRRPSTVAPPPATSPVPLRASSEGAAAGATPAPHLVFPGGGLFFYWQAGAVTYLREAGYDLSGCTMSGASAGALTATLTTCGVDLVEATELALDLSDEAGVWDRGGGLQGIWGPIIEDWLGRLLPTDAHLAAGAGGLSLLVTPVSLPLRAARVDEFGSRDDLVRACMASVHLPWFLDGRWTTEFRGARHIDGSFLAGPGDYSPPAPAPSGGGPGDGSAPASPPPVLRLDWTEDEGMQTQAGDFVKLVSKDGIRSILDRGRTYARDVMEGRGDFDALPRL